MKCICKKWINLFHLLSMIKDVIQMELEVNHGIENYVFENAVVSVIKLIRLL